MNFLLTKFYCSLLTSLGGRVGKHYVRQESKSVKHPKNLGSCEVHKVRHFVKNVKHFNSNP